METEIREPRTQGQGVQLWSEETWKKSVVGAAHWVILRTSVGKAEKLGGYF